MFYKVILQILLAASPRFCFAFCFEEAAARYNVPASLLESIATVESHKNPLAYNVNPNGSRDIGLMQINDGWLPTLNKYGIRKADLWDACTSVHVGAWILAKNISVYGYSWEAVGAYNARSPDKRIKYARKIYRTLAQ